MDTFFINYYISKKKISKVKDQLDFLEMRITRFFKFPEVVKITLDNSVYNALSELSSVIYNVKQFYLTYEYETFEQQDKYIDNCIDIYSITKEKLYKEPKSIENSMEIYLDEISEYAKILESCYRNTDLKNFLSIIRYIIFNLDYLDDELDIIYETMNLKYKDIKTTNKKLEKKLEYLTKE